MTRSQRVFLCIGLVGLAVSAFLLGLQVGVALERNANTPASELPPVEAVEWQP